MINTTITGKLPRVNTDLTAIMKQVVQVMSDSIDMNFETGGRPLWVQRKVDSTGDPLRRTGALRRSKRATSGKDFAQVTMGEGLGVYPFVQQFGSTHAVEISDRSRRFFWAMFHATGETKWKYMAVSSRQAFIVHIPARPYIMFQPEDIEKIMELIGAGIITFSGTATGRGGETSMEIRA